jgi:DNA polymerase
MRELGVDGFDGAGATTTETQSAPQTSAALPTPANPARLSSALRRNADAEQRPITPTPKPDVDTPPAGGVAASSHEQTEMAKRTTRKSTAAPADTPAHIDTLFGEITPMDEASLPRADETLEDIRADIGECIRCPLSQSRTKVVHTEGNPNARLMFVGEAPGADEDASGRPFVGRAGQLLNKIIEAIGLKREDVIIGNVNRCRPPQNRTPTPQEAATCKPFLLRDVAVIQPEVIVVMGNTAMKNLLDTKEGITKLRGQFQDYAGIKVMPTFHPAYLLRSPEETGQAWGDLQAVMKELGLKGKQG